jgi:signal peptidase II
MVLKKKLGTEGKDSSKNIQRVHGTRRKEFKSKDVKVRGYYAIILFLLLVFIDRLTKTWAMGLKGNIDHGIIAFTYTVNTGAGFSILQNTNGILLWLSVIILGLIIYFNARVPKFSLMTISAGIIGNLIDRIFYGNVIDFINLKFWPVFNVADSLVCIGVVWWIIVLWKSDKGIAKDSKKKGRR